MQLEAVTRSVRSGIHRSRRRVPADRRPVRTPGSRRPQSAAQPAGNRATGVIPSGNDRQQASYIPATNGNRRHTYQQQPAPRSKHAGNTKTIHITNSTWKNTQGDSKGKKNYGKIYREHGAALSPTRRQCTFSTDQCYCNISSATQAIFIHVTRRRFSCCFWAKKPMHRSALSVCSFLYVRYQKPYLYFLFVHVQKQ